MTKLAQSFGWEVAEREIKLGGVFGSETPIIDDLTMAEVPNFKAIVHGTTGDVLNVPKPTYTPLLNQQLENAAQMMADASQGTVEGFETFQGGKKVLAFVKAGNNKSKINGNSIEDYIVIGNAHDGTSRIFIGTSTTLMRCANQFADVQRDFRIGHTGDIAVKFEDAINHYRQYYIQRDVMYDRFVKMSKVKIDTSIIESLTDRLFDVDREAITKEEIELSTQKVNQIESFNDSIEGEMSDLGSNLWGYFNAVTHYTTHSRGSNGKNYESNNSFGNVVGSNANFNKKADGIITKELAILS